MEKTPGLGKMNHHPTSSWRPHHLDIGPNTAVRTPDILKLRFMASDSANNDCWPSYIDARGVHSSWDPAPAAAVRCDTHHYSLSAEKQLTRSTHIVVYSNSIRETGLSTTQESSHSNKPVHQSTTTSYERPFADIYGADTPDNRDTLLFYLLGRM